MLSGRLRRLGCVVARPNMGSKGGKMRRGRAVIIVGMRNFQNVFLEEEEGCAEVVVGNVLSYVFEQVAAAQAAAVLFQVDKLGDIEHGRWGT